jgi:hypothetical protein
VTVRNLLFGALVGALALTGCTKDHAKPRPRAAPPAKVTLVRFGSSEIVSPTRAVRPMDDATGTAVLAITQRFFDATVAEPLTKGTAGSLSTAFTADAAQQATTADRAAMFDEGLPRVRSLRAKTEVVQVNGFADDADHLAIVIAKFSWDVTGDGGTVHVVRTGELTLTPVFGSWLVSAYEVTSTRTAAGTTTTTTSVKQ